MVHPLIDLEEISKQFLSLGFKQRSKVFFDRKFVRVKIKDAIIPDGAQELCKPFFVVDIYSKGNEFIMQFNCPIENFETFKNIQD